MSGVKTFIVALIVLPVQGLASDNGLVSDFASCAGRFSAELEHAWLLRDRRSDEIEHNRRQFIDLLEATVAPEQHGQVMNLRLHAKVAHAQLLSQATFTDDADKAAWSIRRARSEIDFCSRFLLES